MDSKIKEKILNFQKSEITEHFIYEKLAKAEKNPENKKVLNRIAAEELEHHNIWQNHTQTEVKPDIFKIWRYFIIAKIFGITFGIKLMEMGEEAAQSAYREIAKYIPETEQIIKEENKHEKDLINLIDEERLRYVGSIVLGLNDALVELTGALAGFTFAFQKTGLIALAGLITGIAASLSMAASEYLSTKAEGKQSPLKASIYTGTTYLLTVLFLIFPYLIFKNFYLSLVLTIFNAILVIAAFTFYISVAKDISFKKRFFEMASISLGISALTFLIGVAIRKFLKIEI